MRDSIAYLITAPIICLVAIFFMIYFAAKAVKLQKKIDEIAHNDSLTSVYNRRFFMELARIQFARSLRTGVDCYFIVFDLDDFNDICKTFGQLAADYALLETASRVKNTIRPYDILGRYTGEGFIILMTDIAMIDKKNVIDATERILKCICDLPVVFEGKKINISASFGIATAAPVHDMNEAIKIADEALHEAKENKQNHIVFLEDAVLA